MSGLATENYFNREHIDTPVDERFLNGDLDEEPAGEAQGAQDGQQGQQREATGEKQTETQLDQGEGAGEGTQTQETETQQVPQETETKTPATIPKARFDEVNAKFKAEAEARAAVEKRLADLEQRLSGNQQQTQQQQTQQQETQAISIKDLQKEYQTALLDGDNEKAIEIQAKIFDEITKTADERAAARYKAERERDQQDAAKRQQDAMLQDFSSAAVKIATDHPILDSNSDQANPDAIEEVVVWRDHYINSGKAPAEALQLAAERVMKIYGQPKKEGSAKEDPRKAETVKRNLADSKKQPPTMDGVGARSPEAGSPEPEDQADWDKLPDKVREQFLQ